MISDVPTNGGKHVTSKNDCALPWIDKQLIYLIGSNDVVRYDIMGCQ